MDPAYPRSFDVREAGKRRRRLPHWEVPEDTYFVTFRLADSLPQHVVNAYVDERDRLLNSEWNRQHPEALDREQVRLYCQKVDRILDRGIGECHLANKVIAPMVASALEHFHCQRYTLHSHCVMPNHVHVVLSTLGEWTLAKITHTWKSYTAHRANELLARTGHFWQDESFDHLVRTDTDLVRFSKYVMANPRKAGLIGWPWCKSFETMLGAGAEGGATPNMGTHRRDACATGNDA